MMTLKKHMDKKKLNGHTYTILNDDDVSAACQQDNIRLEVLVDALNEECTVEYCKNNSDKGSSNDYVEIILPTETHHIHPPSPPSARCLSIALSAVFPCFSSSNKNHRKRFETKYYSPTAYASSGHVDSRKTSRYQPQPSKLSPNQHIHPNPMHTSTAE